MSRKVFQDFANTLPQMLVGWRISEGDLETLADLPNGTLTIDVLSGTATHSTAANPSLYIAGELQAWLQHRLEELKISRESLASAVLVADICSDRIATKRKRILSFDFDCKTKLVSADGRAYCGMLRQKSVWHKRITAADPRPNSVGKP